MKEARIIERTPPVGKPSYTIQHKHWLFKSRWVDAKIWHPEFSITASYDTLDEALFNLPRYDGTKVKRKVVFEQQEEKEG